MPSPVRGEPIPAGRLLGGTAAAQGLLAPYFAGLAHEAIHILYLDGGHRLIRHAAIPGDAYGRADLPLRRIVREALVCDARALVLAHNHPDGDPTPSTADKIATRRLVETAAPLDVAVLDHLIFAGGGVTSFLALGLL